MSDGFSMGVHQKKWGYIFADDSERVWNDVEKGGGWVILDPDGEFDDFVWHGKDKLGKGKAQLWQRLGGVEIDGIEIHQNTRIYHEEREEWLSARVIDVYDDGEPFIRFRVEGTWPRTDFTYDASTLIEMRENGVLTSQKEVNDRAEDVLQQFREKTDE